MMNYDAIREQLTVHLNLDANMTDAWGFTYTVTEINDEVATVIAIPTSHPLSNVRRTYTMTLEGVAEFAAYLARVRG